MLEYNAFVYRKMGLYKEKHKPPTPHNSVVGCDGKWWGSVPSVRKVAGLNTTLAAMKGPWASPSLAVACSASACKLQHRIKLWSRALLKGSCCEKRYRNG